MSSLLRRVYDNCMREAENEVHMPSWNGVVKGPGGCAGREQMTRVYFIRDTIWGGQSSHLVADGELQRTEAWTQKPR